MRKNNSKRNMALVILESAATAGVLCTPIMTPFFLNIGLNQTEIALSQMAFTAVAMILNLPLGWVADRFSRKWANVIGDLLVALSLLLYSGADSFWHVVLFESICGIGCALSQGVDSTLLKHFAGKIDASGKLFKDKFTTMASCNQIASLVLIILGGPIGAISFRLAIGLSAVPYLIGAVFSFFIEDDSEKLSAESTPVREIVGLVKRNIRNAPLRLRIFSYAIARECTHGIIWVFTPLMLAVGVPLSIVSMGWAANYVVAFLGTKLAKRYVSRAKDWQLFIVPIVLVCSASLIMFVNLNIITVWLYLLFGLAQGWTSATMMPLVKEHVKPAEQSSIESLARVIAQFVYIGSVWLINYAADFDPRYALITTAAIFAPLAIPIAIKLRKE